MPRVGTCSFAVTPTDMLTLQRTMITMRNSSSCGSDGLCIRVLKAAFPVIGVIILHIINACLAVSDFPSSWKHSIVHPIYTTGDPSDPSNFRPISIIPIISKIVERIVHCTTTTLFLPVGPPPSLLLAAWFSTPSFDGNRACHHLRSHTLCHRWRGSVALMPH